MSRKILGFIIAVVLTFTLVGCTANNNKDNGKIKIITTLFPQYDFAKQIVGDKGDVELLLPPGVESHTYDPSASDIVNIGKADMFIYTENIWKYGQIRLLKILKAKMLKLWMFQKELL